MWTVDGFLFHLDSTVYSVFLILQVGWIRSSSC